MNADDRRLDQLLKALADATRRTLLDRLRDRPGLTLGELVAGLRQSRQALSKHVALLEEAELVVPMWRGREKLHYLNPAPLAELPSRWVAGSARELRSAGGALRQALQSQPAADTPAGLPPAAPRAPRAQPAPRDPIATLLLAPPSPRLQGQPVMQPDALAAARDYLAQTAQAVQALVAALPATQGHARPAKDGFSLVEHLWHLADIEALGWHVRMACILAEARPRLPGVDGDRLAVEGRYQTRPWRGAARRFVAERRRTLAALAHFDADVLRRPVVFAGQRARAGGVVAAAVAHDLEHRTALAECWERERKLATKGSAR